MLDAHTNPGRGQTNTQYFFGARFPMVCSVCSHLLLSKPKGCYHPPTLRGTPTWTCCGGCGPGSGSFACVGSWISSCCGSGTCGGTCSWIAWGGGGGRDQCPYPCWRWARGSVGGVRAGGGPSYLCRERDRDLRRRDLDRERECLRFSSFLTVDNEQRTQLWYSEGSRNQNENPEETALGN